MSTGILNFITQPQGLWMHVAQKPKILGLITILNIKNICKYREIPYWKKWEPNRRPQISKFPDFSLTLNTFINFPDFSMTFQKFFFPGFPGFPEALWTLCYPKLVRTTSQKGIDGSSSNLHTSCIWGSLSSLLFLRCQGQRSRSPEAKKVKILDWLYLEKYWADSLQTKTKMYS